MTSYYNEHDKNASAWLRELIKAGHIAPGDADERNVADVRPTELAGYSQCHFFAGIGGWSYALRLAGWSDDRPVWTGSCPCQPFSAAGTGKGFDDERHLWPDWFWLIMQCRPGVIFGEQVESAVKHGWLDLVQDDLEGNGFAGGAPGLPACSIGAPHIRQRAWFVAESHGGQRNGFADGEGRERNGTQTGRQEGNGGTAARAHAGELAESESQQYDRSGNARRGRGAASVGGATRGFRGPPRRPPVRRG